MVRILFWLFSANAAFARSSLTSAASESLRWNSVTQTYDKDGFTRTIKVITSWNSLVAVDLKLATVTTSVARTSSLPAKNATPTATKTVVTEALPMTSIFTTMDHWCTATAYTDLCGYPEPSPGLAFPAKDGKHNCWEHCYSESLVCNFILVNHDHNPGSCSLYPGSTFDSALQLPCTRNYAATIEVLGTTICNEWITTSTAIIEPPPPPSRCDYKLLEEDQICSFNSTPLASIKIQGHLPANFLRRCTENCVHNPTCKWYLVSSQSPWIGNAVEPWVQCLLFDVPFNNQTVSECTKTLDDIPQYGYQAYGRPAAGCYDDLNHPHHMGVELL